jgi:predicted transglutaminase-like cysteine proteinase
MNNQLMKNAFLSVALGMFALPVIAQSAPATDPAPKSEVGQRAENQQDRIAQGVKSGQLTPRETVHLERNEARINRQVRAERKANGGKLTPQERAQVNREQNRESRQIYRAKHNAHRQ